MGWCALQVPLPSDAPQQLFGGTPRMLLAPEAVVDGAIVTSLFSRVAGTSITLRCSLRPHPALAPAVHLLPADVLIGAFDTVSGLLAKAPQGRGAPSTLLEPVVRAPMPISVEGVHLHFAEPVRDFEARLLATLRGKDGADDAAKLLGKENAPTSPGGTPRAPRATRVVERRLRVGVHSRVGFVGQPQCVQLVQDPEDPECLRFHGAVVLPHGTDPDAGDDLVCQIEYVAEVDGSGAVAPPQRPRGRRGGSFRKRAAAAAAAAAPSEVRRVVVARWAPVVLPPDIEAAPTAVRLETLCGPGICPTGSLVLAADTAPPVTLELVVGPDGTEGRAKVKSHRRKDKSGRRQREHLHSSPVRARPRTATPEDGPADDEGADAGDESSLDGSMEEVPTGPTDLPVLATPSISTSKRGAKGFTGLASLPRATQTALFERGFQDPLDRSLLPPEMVLRNETAPAGPGLLNAEAEAADTLRVNEVAFQFLAFEALPSGAGLLTGAPPGIRVTFSFYRFRPYASESLRLQRLGEGADTGPAVQAIVDAAGNPGPTAHFTVLPAVDEPPGVPPFVQYLDGSTLQMDVWDSTSQLLLGSAALNLRELLRGGQPAVQAIVELEVLRHRMDDSELDRPWLCGGVATSTLRGGGGIRGGEDVVVAKLFVRLASYGRTVSATDGPLPASRTRTAAKARKRAPLFPAAASAGGGTVRRVRTVGRLADAVPELASTLGATRVEDDALRKTQRLESIRRARGLVAGTGTAPVLDRTGGPLPPPPRSLQSTGELATLQGYRRPHRDEKIMALLSDAITSDVTLQCAFGAAVYVEYTFVNPAAAEQAFSLKCHSELQELRLLTEVSEWRYFRTLYHSDCRIEANLLRPLPDGRTLVLLGPGEVVTIPLIFQSFAFDAGSHGLEAGAKPSDAVPQQRREARLSVANADTDEMAGLLHVTAQLQPFTVDREFRFWQAGGQFLKRTLRLPAGVLAGAAEAIATREGRRQLEPGELLAGVRCSDPRVVCESWVADRSEPQDITLKFPVGAAPSVESFYVALYADRYLATVVQTWLVHVHALERLEVSANLGQAHRGTVALRAGQQTRRVCCYASDPELEPAQREPFLLTASSVHACGIVYTPRALGGSTHFLTVVDVEFGHLLAMYLVVCTCHAPQVSRQLQLVLPLGVLRHKRVSYRNPYPSELQLTFRASRPDLVQLRDPTLQLLGGTSDYIRMQWLPHDVPSCEEVYIFISDGGGQLEECFLIRATYGTGESAA